MRENCVWNQATWHRVPPTRRCVSTCMLTHDAVNVSIFSRLLDWSWVPVDMAATITGSRTRGLPYVEVFSNLVYESSVETRVDLLSRNVDVA